MSTDMNENSMTTDTDLDKLRRFLSTLFYFSSDISDEIGERVRALIFALITNALSIEEFHGKLQSTTNFPLRPFAIPFLKSTLPLLQNDLLRLARQSKQSIHQYLIQHDEYLFLSRDLLENESNKNSSNEQINRNGKRNLYEETKERSFSSYLDEYTIDDHWKHAENMLNCIVEMITKSKRIFYILQQRDFHLRHLIQTNDFEWRRRIADVSRKAEDTILEIKRQSIIDQQKSNESFLHEREQYQQLKNQTYDEIYSHFNRQEDRPENCWHCGRKALEICSNCNFARYCGQYCQHRDWNIHQNICNSNLKLKYHDDPQVYHRSIQKTCSPPTMTTIKKETN